MRYGFSLVELSIVLVILGLLVGGVLTGQSLIRAAELRSVTTEFEKYQAAVNTFRDKYFQLPGDMTNATSFWGVMTNCGAASPSGTGTQTCNGDGNAMIAEGAAAGQTGERFGFWKQLANAGLIEGSYTGISGPGGIGNHAVPGTNAPVSKYANGAWGISWADVAVSSATAMMYAKHYGNHLVFGAGNASGQPNNPVLSPEMAWNIDTKMDDGKPAYGKVIARYWNDLCSVADDGTSANNDFAASYKLTDATAQCALAFIVAF